MLSATSASPRFLPPSPPSSLSFVRHCVAYLLPPILLEPLPLFLLLIVLSRCHYLVIVVILSYRRRLSSLSRRRRLFFSSSHLSSSAVAAPLKLRPPNHPPPTLPLLSLLIVVYHVVGHERIALIPSPFPHAVVVLCPPLCCLASATYTP